MANQQKSQDPQILAELADCYSLIDEVRISNISRTSGWLLTQFNNQKDPQAFYTKGILNKVDVTAPTIQDFNIDDNGKGQGQYWVNVTDNLVGVSQVFAELNGSIVNLTYNGSLWIYQINPNFGDYYTFRIKNATDFLNNSLTVLSSYLNYTFNYDVQKPIITEWDYFSNLNDYGTFNTNITSGWGDIDTVLVVITKIGSIST